LKDTPLMTRIPSGSAKNGGSPVRQEILPYFLSSRHA
jgi:hypothetical protein